MDCGRDEHCDVNGFCAAGPGADAGSVEDGGPPPTDGGAPADSGPALVDAGADDAGPPDADAGIDAGARDAGVPAEDGGAVDSSAPCPTLPEPTGTVHNVGPGNVSGLASLFSSLAIGDTVVLAAGDYDLTQTDALVLDTYGVTLRGATGDADDVRLNAGDETGPSSR
jgi:hypothetical protein